MADYARPSVSRDSNYARSSVPRDLRPPLVHQTAPRGGAVLPGTRLSKQLRAQEMKSKVFSDDVDVNEVTQILGKLRTLTYPGPRWRPDRFQASRMHSVPSSGRGRGDGQRGDRFPPSYNRTPPGSIEEELEPLDLTERNVRAPRPDGLRAPLFLETESPNAAATEAQKDIPEDGAADRSSNRNSTSSVDEEVVIRPNVPEGVQLRVRKKKAKRDPTGALPRSLMRSRIKPSIVGSSHIFERLELDFLNRAEAVLGHVTLGRNSHKNVEKRINKFYGSERRANKGQQSGEERAPTEQDPQTSLVGQDSGDLVCGCCYIHLVGPYIIQCPEGHLFCLECLHSYAVEVAYGQARPPLWCMTNDCDETFSHSQIQKALSLEELVHYEERLQEEAVLMAGLLSDLVRCPKCNFPALPDPGEDVFRCPSAACGHESCVKCGEDWGSHEGLSCEEVETRDETKVRLTYEELMTRATVRMCYRCHAKFTKEEGCNHMKCRCGALMCYLCRKPAIDYSHFCSHMHEPGKGCTKCRKCYLWTNPEQDEQRAIEELKAQGQYERQRKGFVGDRPIGAPSVL